MISQKLGQPADGHSKSQRGNCAGIVTACARIVTGWFWKGDLREATGGYLKAKATGTVVA